MSHSLQEYFHDYNTTLGDSYREVLPRPLYVAVAKSEFHPNVKSAQDDQQIELRLGEKYFVINEDNPNWCYAFNSVGLMGYVPKNYLEVLF